MLRGIGVRMHPDEAHLGEGKCRRWIADTSGVLDAHGKPLKRIRWTLNGVSISRALAIRQERIAKLLSGETPPKEPSKRVSHETSSQQDITFAEYVEDRFMPWIESRLESSTVEARRYVLEKHILPLVGKLSLKEAASLRGIEKVHHYLMEARTERKGEPYAIGHKNAIQSAYTTVLHHAANPRTCSPPLIEHIMVEPFRENRSRIVDADGNEVGHLREKAISPTRMQALIRATRTMQAHLASSVVGSRLLAKHSEAYWYVLVGLGYHSGCRVGEACARRWSDVDLSTGRMLIDSQIRVTGDEFIPYTKTRRGARLMLAPPMLDALRRLHHEVEPDPQDFILGKRRSGKPYLSPNTLRDRYALLCEHAWGDASYHYHALRHTFATSMADANIPIAQIQRACRHANIRQTLGYIHPDMDAVDQATAAIGVPKLQVLRGGKLASG